MKEYENAKHMLEYWAQHYDKIAKSISYWGYKPETFAKKFSLHRSLIYKGLNGEKIDNNWFRDVYINNYKKAFGKDPLTS